MPESPARPRTMFEGRGSRLLLAAFAAVAVVGALFFFFTTPDDGTASDGGGAGELSSLETRTYEGRVAWEVTIDAGESTRFAHVIGASADVVVVSYRPTVDSPVVVLGLDRGTGEERWRRDFDVQPDDVAPWGWGFSPPRPADGILGHRVSPEEAFVYDDTVIVVPELDADIVVLDAATGDVKWQRPGLWIALRPEVWTVHPGAQQTIAVDAETGDELWTADGTLSESDGSTLYGRFGDDPVDIATGEVRSDLIGLRRDDVVERPSVTIDIGPGLSTEVLTPRDGRVLVGCRSDAGVLAVTTVGVDADGVPTGEFVPCETSVPVVEASLLAWDRHVGSAWVEPISVGGSPIDRLVAVVLEAPSAFISPGDDVSAEGEPSIVLARVADSLVMVESTGFFVDPARFTTLGSNEAPVVIGESSLAEIIDGGILTYGGDTGIVTLIE